MEKFDLLVYFEHTDDDVPIAMPNEIFDDFKDCPQFKNFRQQAFAYCYYYLSCYLYRNLKYGGNDYKKFSQMALLDALGVSQRRYNPITKKGGVLDSLGYTTSETDFPIGVEWDGETLTGFITFYGYLDKEFRKHADIHPHFLIKKPTKAFTRTVKELECEGTFFDSYFSHIIDFSIFSKCMKHSKYSFEMFYIYGFLLKMFKHYKKKNLNRSYLAKCLGITTDSLRKYLNELVSNGLLEITESKFFKYKLLDNVNFQFQKKT